MGQQIAELVEIVDNSAKVTQPLRQTDQLKAIIHYEGWGIETSLPYRT